MFVPAYTDLVKALDNIDIGIDVELIDFDNKETREEPEILDNIEEEAKITLYHYEKGKWIQVMELKDKMPLGDFIDVVMKGKGIHRVIMSDYDGECSTNIRFSGPKKKR